MSVNLTESILRGAPRQYVKKKEIVALAESKSVHGITFSDLIGTGLISGEKYATSASGAKRRAQNCLKRYRSSGVLFTMGDHRPQVYYATSLESEIRKSKSIPIRHTGVTHQRDLDSNQLQTLEGWVLPLLPQAPLHIHKLNFYTTLPAECYSQLKLPIDKGNSGKGWSDIIGSFLATFTLYPNGTLMIYTESSSRPHNIEDELDYTRLIEFIGQIRDRIILVLADKHERIVPHVTNWMLTECDINKDIPISHSLLPLSLNVQFAYMDQIFRLYFKSMGQETVCRVEHSLTPKKPVPAAIHEIMTLEGLQKQVATLREKKADQAKSDCSNSLVNET